MVVALSNRYLRTIRIVKTIFRGWLFEELKIVPISEISDINAVEKDGKHVLTYFWKGYREELSSKSVQEAREFSDNLRRLVNVGAETHDSGGISGEIEKLASLADKGIAVCAGIVVGDIALGDLRDYGYHGQNDSQCKKNSTKYHYPPHLLLD